jgi:putative ABC transport system permease protein
MLAGPQGFDASGLLTLQVTLPESRYDEPQARRGFARGVSERLAALPGVASVAYANVLPARGFNSSREIRVEGGPARDENDPSYADSRSVSVGYFAAMRIPIHSGRDLAPADGEGTLPVAVVSRSFAERYWPGRDPIGRRFRPGTGDAPWVTVVGVCGDVIHQWFSRRNHPTYYRPYAQDPRIDVAFALRTRDDPDALAAAARRAVTAVDPDQPAYDVRSMRRALALATIGLQYVAAIMAAFGALALALAVSGVYGVTSYRVSLRTQEIGVRVALGASARDVLRLTMGQAAALTGLGLVVGSALGLAAARGLQAALMGAVELDPRTFASVTALLAVAALVAAYVPARRALAVDPSRALRAE